MRITKLPNGQLRVPLVLTGEDRDADGTVVIGPGDPRYREYQVVALTEEEQAARERADQSVNAELLARWNSRFEAQRDQSP